MLWRLTVDTENLEPSWINEKLGALINLYMVYDCKWGIVNTVHNSVVHVQVKIYMYELVCSIFMINLANDTKEISLNKFY